MYSFFVSSTFKDMHYERDIINQCITPRINFMLQKFNQSMRVVDLRWGIDTSTMSENDASDKVLAVCHSVIDSCKPYFIVFIGDRYGYIPQGSDISITHMEIIHGIIENADKSHVYIYIREADYSGAPDSFLCDCFDSDKKKYNRLRELKDYLKQNYKANCKTYHSKWSSERQCLVSDDLEELICSNLEADLVAMNSGVCFRSELHKQIHENEVILKESLIDVYHNEAMIERDLHSIKADESPFAVIGATGIGKSVYLSLLCDRLKTEGENAHIIYCGRSAFSCSSRNIAEYLLYVLTTETNKDYDFEYCASLTYEEIVSVMLSIKDVLCEKQYLFIDALEKCDFNIRNFIAWCDCFFAGRIKIVFSESVISDKTDDSKGHSASVLQYACDDYKSMIKTAFKKYSKTVPDTLVKLMSERIQSPLQLNILLSRLLNLNALDYKTIHESGDGAEAINAYLEQVVKNSPDNTAAAIGTYVEDYIHSGARREFVMFLLHIIALCPFGIAEDDIRAITKDEIDWVEIEYLGFLESLSLIVRVNENGIISISHEIVRESICALFADIQKRVCRLVAQHFIHRNDPDSATVKTIFSVLLRADLKKELFAFLTDNIRLLSSRDQKDLLIADEIRGFILNLLYLDKGEYLFSFFAEQCETPHDYLLFQQILESSFLSVQEYLDEGVLLDLAYAAVLMPIRLNFEVNSTMERCIRFLKEHNVSQGAIDKFVNDCNQKCPTANRANPTIEEQLELLKSTDDIESFSAFYPLLEKAKELATSKDAVPQALKILNHLFAALQRGDSLLNEEQRCLLERRIYSISASAFKTIGDYDRALENDKKALAVSGKMYRQNPSHPNLLQYRTQIYNVANIVEAQAISKGDDLELWADVKRLFEEACEYDSKVLAAEFRENWAIEFAEDLFSLSNANLRINDTTAGAARCKDGIKLLEKYRRDDWPTLLYSKICAVSVQPLFNICAYGEIETAKELAPFVLDILKRVMRSKDSDAMRIIYQTGQMISDSYDVIIASLQKNGNADDLIFVLTLLYSFFYELLPVADYEMRTMLLRAKFALANTVFFMKQDNQKTFEELNELIDLTANKKLAFPDRNCKIDAKMSDLLIHSYALYIVCAERVGEKEIAERCIKYSVEYAKYFSVCLTFSSNDYPMVLFFMAMKIISCNCRAGVKEILEAAQNGIENGNYNSEKYREIKNAIYQCLNDLT